MSLIAGGSLVWAWGIYRAVCTTVSDEDSSTGRDWTWDDAPLHTAPGCLLRNITIVWSSQYQLAFVVSAVIVGTSKSSSFGEHD